MNNYELVQVFTTGKNASWFDECKKLISDFCADIDRDLLAEVYADVFDIYHGQYPGFDISDAKYHDFSHACAATLATTRLFHGLVIDGWNISQTTVEQGIISTLFHDIGWLPSSDESLGGNTPSYENHEERSISFMKHYLVQKGFTTDYCKDCADIVKCTDLEVVPDMLDFRSEGKKIGGYVVGSADLLSQMADRCYLERLPFLFREQGYSALLQFDTPVELFEKTAEFHSKTVMARLEGTFHNVYKSMRSHFRVRWGLDTDLYTDNIQKNLKFLKKIVGECEGEFACIEKRLRRNIRSL